MPTIGKTNEEARQSGALEDIADQIAELAAAKKSKEMPEMIFTIHRDSEGDIATITCKCKE